MTVFEPNWVAFGDELDALLEKHGISKTLDMPTFLLGTCVRDFLGNLRRANQFRDMWKAGKIETPNSRESIERRMLASRAMRRTGKCAKEICEEDLQYERTLEAYRGASATGQGGE